MKDIDFTPTTNGLNATPGYSRDLAVIIAVGVGLMLILGLLAKYFRKSRQPRSFAGRSEHEGAEARSQPAAAASQASGRRRRREHRPRNPTLAERGGLPPMRSDEASGNH